VIFDHHGPGEFRGPSDRARSLPPRCAERRARKPRPQWRGEPREQHEQRSASVSSYRQPAVSQGRPLPPRETAAARPSSFSATEPTCPTACAAGVVGPRTSRSEKRVAPAPGENGPVRLRWAPASELGSEPIRPAAPSSADRIHTMDNQEGLTCARQENTRRASESDMPMLARRRGRICGDPSPGLPGSCFCTIGFFAEDVAAARSIPQIGIRLREDER
jgi:hypothetical protein